MSSLYACTQTSCIRGLSESLYDFLAPIALLYSSMLSTDRLSRALTNTLEGVGEGVFRAIFALDDRVELLERGVGL